MKLALLAALGLSTLLASCGGGDDDPTPTPAASPTAEPTARPTATPEPSPSPRATPPPTQPARTFDGGTLGPVDAAGTASSVTTLQAVRVGNDIGFDTIVFEFAGETVPAYRVEFVDRQPVCASAGGGSSGSAATPTGAPTQRIRGTPSPTTGPTLAPTAVPTATPTPVPVTGAALLAIRMAPAAGSSVNRTSLRGGERALLEASQVCDTGTAVTWLMGLSGKNQFRVKVLDAPPRIVVDIEQ